MDKASSSEGSGSLATRVRTGFEGANVNAAQKRADCCEAGRLRGTRIPEHPLYFLDNFQKLYLRKFVEIWFIPLISLLIFLNLTFICVSSDPLINFLSMLHWSICFFISSTVSPLE